MKKVIEQNRGFSENLSSNTNKSKFEKNGKKGKC